ncbi:hypothetical protein ACVWZ9_001953 [Pseudomonas chlororaphis]
MSNLIKQIALVSQTPAVSLDEVLKISAALQKQVSRDFQSIWDIRATVDAFSRVEDVPDGYWHIIIRDDIGYPGAGGIHLDRNGQPYALVDSSAGTPIVCSHELLEMLVDPFGNRMISSNSIKPDQGRVRYLVEVCDPSEHEDFGYDVNGIRLSDFYTPNFFSPVASSGTRYSFTGAIEAPRQVLKGGYISWMDPETDLWWQGKNRGTEVEFDGPFNWKLEDGRSWRETVDMHTFDFRQQLQGEKLSGKKKAKNLFFSTAIKSASSASSAQLMEDIEKLIESTKR